MVKRFGPTVAEGQGAATPIPTGHGRERRRASRFRTLRPASAVLRRHIPVTLIDISGAGALVEHCHGLKLGEIHEITIEAGRRAVQLRGRVARSMASHIRRSGTQSFLIYRTGFAFLNLPPHALPEFMQPLQAQAEGPCPVSARQLNPAPGDPRRLGGLENFTALSLPLCGRPVPGAQDGFIPATVKQG